MHGVQNVQFLQLPLSKAYKHLGNQICVPHALLGIVNMLNCLHKFPTKLDVAMVIERFLQNKTNISNLHAISTQSGFLVSGQPIDIDDGQVKIIESFRADLMQGTIPVGQAWTTLGLQPMSQVENAPEPEVPGTVPFPLFEPVQICTSGRTLEAWIPF